MRRTALSALMLSLAAGSALAPLPSLAQAPPRDTPPPGVSVAQPAGDVCPPGGKYITDPYAPKPAFPNQTRAPRLKTPAGDFKVETVIGGLKRPRVVVFLPDGRMLLVENRDEVRILGKDGKLSAPIAGIPHIDPGFLTGVMELVLDPDFAHNRTVYFTYTSNKPGQPPAAPGQRLETEGHLIKAKLSPTGDALVDQQVLYHGGTMRRLVVMPDRALLFTTVSGDGKAAQQLDAEGGKVLRINLDGSAPRDNPFVKQREVHPLAYAYGLRDPDGLARDAAGGVWTVEHGPRGGDELNKIIAGRNYGYPLIGYGRDYSNAPINNDATAGLGLEQPVYYWTPDIAPSGLMVYSGRMFPRWRGDVFVGGLVAESLIRLQLKKGQVAGEEFLLADRCNRIRDVREGPDGSIYLLTDADNGELMRISKR